MQNTSPTSTNVVQPEPYAAEYEYRIRRGERVSGILRFDAPLSGVQIASLNMGLAIIGHHVEIIGMQWPKCHDCQRTTRATRMHCTNCGETICVDRSDCQRARGYPVDHH